MFTLHCKPLYAPTDLDPHERLFTPARLRRHTHQTYLIIKPIPWGKSDRALFSCLRGTLPAGGFLWVSKVPDANVSRHMVLIPC